jgi:hypothetical protein
MKRTALSLGLAAAMLAAPGAWAALPFGFFDPRPGPGVPGATGVIPLTGWALDDDGVHSVDILVDGALAGRTTYGDHRPGVAAAHPGFPDSAAAGFVFQLDTTRHVNGLHTVSALVTSESGERIFLNPLLFEVVNTVTALVPFGDIDFPPDNADLFGNCDVAGPRRYNVITGWALDTGIEIGDTGLGYVELLIDGSLWANTRVDCTFDAARGGLTDCYGLRRFDIESGFPALRDAPHSGFRFVLDVGFLIDFGYVPGFHVLTIRAGDVRGQVAEIAELPVFFFCDDFIGNEGSFGDIDLPMTGFGGRPVSGSFAFSGWALDFEGVAEVLVFVDGHPVGTAGYGGLRPAVSSQFPGFPDSAAPAWGFVLDTTTLVNGPHNLQVVVRDASPAAVETLIGERPIEVNNP